MNGGVEYLKNLPSVRPDRIGAMGFCFWGGMVWLLCARNPDTKGGGALLWPPPPLKEVANIRASVLGLYGATDNFINPQVPGLETALQKSEQDLSFRHLRGRGARLLQRHRPGVQRIDCASDLAGWPGVVPPLPHGLRAPVGGAAKGDPISSS